MKDTPILASELIKKLEEIIKEKGDLPVFIYEDIVGPYTLDSDGIEVKKDTIVLGVY